MPILGLLEVLDHGGMISSVLFSSEERRLYTWPPGLGRWRWSAVFCGTEPWWMQERGWDTCPELLVHCFTISYLTNGIQYEQNCFTCKYVLCHQEDQTPLHIASRLGKTEIVQLLLQHMAHPDAATSNGYTPLHIAAREGHLDVTSVLLEAGAAHSLATKVLSED